MPNLKRRSPTGLVQHRWRLAATLLARSNWHLQHNERRKELHRLQAKYPEEAEKLARKVRAANPTRRWWGSGTTVISGEPPRTMSVCGRAPTQASRNTELVPAAACSLPDATDAPGVRLAALSIHASN